MGPEIGPGMKIGKKTLPKNRKSGGILFLGLFFLLVFIQGRPKHNHNHNFPKMFASDATPKWHWMTHQMKNLYGFSVFHCVGRGIWCVIWGYPKNEKWGPAR